MTEFLEFRNSKWFFVLWIIAAILFFYYRGWYKLKVNESKFCDAEINCKIVKLERQNGWLHLTLAIGSNQHFLPTCTSNCEILTSEFMDKVKPSDKLIKKAYANTFLTVRGTDTLTWHVDCPY